MLLISPTTRGNAGDSLFRGIFPVHRNTRHRHYILCSIETVLGINGRKLVQIPPGLTVPIINTGQSWKVLFYADDTMFDHFNKMLRLLVFTWLTVEYLAGKTRLNLQRCVRPCCRFARCCVSRTRWAQGVLAEVHTPAPQARRQPPPHRWVPVGNRFLGLRRE